MVCLKSNPVYQKLVRAKEYFADLHEKTLNRFRKRNKVAVTEVVRMSNETFFMEADIEDLKSMLYDSKMILNFKVESELEPSIEGKRLMQVYTEHIEQARRTVVRQPEPRRPVTATPRPESTQSTGSTRSILVQSRNGKGNQNKFM